MTVKWREAQKLTSCLPEYSIESGKAGKKVWRKSGGAGCGIDNPGDSPGHCMDQKYGERSMFYEHSAWFQG